MEITQFIPRNNLLIMERTSLHQGLLFLADGHDFEESLGTKHLEIRLRHHISWMVSALCTKAYANKKKKDEYEVSAFHCGAKIRKNAHLMNKVGAPKNKCL